MYRKVTVGNMGITCTPPPPFLELSVQNASNSNSIEFASKLKLSCSLPPKDQYFVFRGVPRGAVYIVWGCLFPMGLFQ